MRLSLATSARPRNHAPREYGRGRLGRLPLMAAVVCLGRLPATASGVSVRCSVDRSEVTVGDRLTFTLIIESDPKVKVIPPDVGVNLSHFEVKDYTLTHPPASGKKVTRVDYVLATFQTGDQTIPPLTVTYLENGKRRQVHTDKITIHVKSLAPSAAKEPKDIKPPVEVPPNWSGFRLAGALAAGALVVVWSLVAWIRRRRRALGERQAAEPPRPAHETALEELDVLRRSSLLAEERYKEYYSGVADALRRYLEGRYGIRALDETTGETVRQLQRGLLALDRVEEVRVLLEKCDLVKFAKFLPSDPTTDAAETLTAVCEFVQATRPVSVEAREEDEEESSGEEGNDQSEETGEEGENDERDPSSGSHTQPEDSETEAAQ